MQQVFAFYARIFALTQCRRVGQPFADVYKPKPVESPLG